MNLKNLQAQLRDFAAERDWQPLHTPKNLAMALMVEAAELAEIFQWQTPEQSQAAHTDPEMHQRIADELADVLLYLLQIADHTAVDLESAVRAKMGKNAKKHPALQQTPPPLPPETAMPAPPTHVLVDWENVQPKDVEIRALAPEVTDVWLFHGPKQKKVDAHQLLFGERATLVPIARIGKNALDFHLSFYMGYIASKKPQARFVVISNDKGYGPMLEHMINLGFSAQQVGFDNGKKTPVMTPAKLSVETPSPAKKLAVKKVLQPPFHSGAPGGKAARPKNEPAAKKPVPAVKKAAPVKTTAVVKQATPAKKAGVKSTATKAAAKTTTPVKKIAKLAAPTQVSGTWDLDKATQHVSASLKKTTSRPSRKAKLLSSIKSLLGPPPQTVR